MDTLFKAAPSCSPAEVRAEAQEMHDLALKELATLKKAPESDLRNHKIADLEKDIAHIAGLLAFKSEATGKGRGSSYSVPASGARGGQLERDIVTRQEEVHTVHFNDGSKRDVHVVVTDEKGNRLPDEAIDKTARSMAQQIKSREHKAAQGEGGRRVVGQDVKGPDPSRWEVGTEVDEGGINVAPSKRTREYVAGGRDEFTPLGKEKALKTSERKQEKETQKQQFRDASKKSGKDGALYVTGNQWLVSIGGDIHEVPGKRGAKKSDVIAGVKADLASKVAEERDLKDRYEAAWKGAQARGQSREEFEDEFYQRKAAPKPAKEAPPEEEATPLTSLSELPDHRRELSDKAHTMPFRAYKGAIEKFYRDKGATPKKVKATRDRALTQLLGRKQRDEITPKAYGKRSKYIKGQAEEVLKKIRGRMGAVGEEHAQLTQEAAKDSDKLRKIHPDNKKYFPDEEKTSSKSSKRDEIIESLGGKRGIPQGVKTSLSPLREALGLEVKDSDVGNDHKTHVKKLKDAGISSAPTEILSGESEFQVYARESTESKKKRGQTDEEARNRAQLMDWVAGIKNNLRKYLDGVFEKHDSADVTKEFQAIMDEVGEQLSATHGDVPRRKGDPAEPWRSPARHRANWKNPIFGSLSEKSQHEIMDKITNIEKSVIGNLTDTGADLMAGLFLPSNLFKALNLSEEHKIEEFKNSFGEATSGVNPSTMNSALRERKEKKKDDDETKKSLNLGFYVRC